MHVIFLGIVSKPEKLILYPYSSVAGNKMQYNLLRYLSQYEDMSIDVVSFHNSNKWVVKSSFEPLFGDNCRLWQVGYLNIPILKQLILPIITFLKASSLVRRDDVIMSYDIYPIQGIPLRLLKGRVSNRIVCLLADLSIGGVYSERGWRSKLRRIYDRNTIKNMRGCPNYIVLNPNVVKKYIPNSNYIVMDGGVEPSDYEGHVNYWNGDVKNVVYTGALVDYSGILNLIQALDYIKNTSIVLDIYGDGVLREDIEKLSLSSQRIRYHGRVSNEEALMAQQTAWLLINPRPVDNNIAQVTFPSKIFEYLMSGRPVVTTRLNGFSREYDQLLFWAGSGSPQELADAINKVDCINNDHLKTMSSNARDYLLKNKTWKDNADLVYSFLKGLYLHE